MTINGPRGRIDVVRTYRPLSNNPGPFGIGTNHNYGYELDTSQFVRGSGTMLNLVMPDGNQFPFVEQPNGTFTNSTIPAMSGVVITVISNPATNPTGVFNLRWKDGTTYQFETSALGPLLAFLTSITDLNANTITLTRNPAQPFQLTQITDPVGRSLTLAYDSSNRIVSITDPLGRTVSYTYTSQGALGSATNPAGGTETFQYDSQNRLTQLTDERGVVALQNTYDANGRVVQQVQADGGVWKFAYTLLNPLVPTSPVLLTVATDPMGNQTTYHFDPQGFLLDVTDATGQQVVLNRVAQTNNLAQSWTGAAACRICGNPTLGDLTFSFDGIGNILTRTDALGNTRTFTYEPVSNNVASFTDASGDASRFTYDARGNLLTFTDANGSTASFSYDSFGQLLQTTDPLKNTTAFSYDASGNLSSVTDALGNVTAIAYDPASRPLVITDPLGRRAQVSYDALDRPVALTDSRGNTARYTYDAVGNLLSVTDRNGNTVTFTYDAMSRLLTRTDPSGKSDSRQYDLDGNLISFTDRRGQTSKFTYDSLNRLASETYPDGATVVYSYDANDRPVHVQDSQAGAFDFVYDAAGRLTSSAGPFGTVQYSYDASGRVTSRQVVGQAAAQYSYDLDGNVTSAAMPQASANFTYDALGRLLTIGRSNGISTTYAYDALSELLSATHAGAAGVIDAETYAYNAAGDRAASTRNIAQPLTTQPVTNQYDAADRLVQSTGTPAATYAYDANGNTISKTDATGATTYAWDSRNRLQSITAPSGQKTTFVYDFAGNLISQTDAGPTLNLTQNFVLDDLTNVVLLSKSTGEQLSILTGRDFDEPLAVVQGNGAVAYGLADAIGSIVAAVDQGGAVASKIFYEPFGQTTLTGTGYPFQYVGKMPVAANLYYNRARYYDPGAARFTSEDPSESEDTDVNPYAYALDDPISLVDFDGRGAGQPAGLGATRACIPLKVKSPKCPKPRKYPKPPNKPKPPPPPSVRRHKSSR